MLKGPTKIGLVLSTARFWPPVVISAVVGVLILPVIGILGAILGKPIPDAIAMGLIGIQVMTWIAPAAVLARRTGVLKAVAGSVVATAGQGLLLSLLMAGMAITDGHPQGIVQTVGVGLYVGVVGGIALAIAAAAVGAVAGFVGWLAGRAWVAVGRRRTPLPSA